MTRGRERGAVGDDPTAGDDRREGPTMSVVNRQKARQAALFAAEAEGPFAGVVLNRPVDTVLTYRIPKRLAPALKPGGRVTVPLGKGNKPAVGYCVKVDTEPEAGLEPAKIK